MFFPLLTGGLLCISGSVDEIGEHASVPKISFPQDHYLIFIMQDIMLRYVKHKEEGQNISGDQRKNFQGKKEKRNNLHLFTAA